MSGATGATVLVVEDEVLVRELVHTILVRAGYDVVAAANSDEAIAIVRARDGRVDVVLSDVILSGPTGVQLVEELLCRWPHLRAIYMSGYTADALGSRGIVADTTTFLQKPCSADALLEAVACAARPSSPPGAEAA